MNTQISGLKLFTPTSCDKINLQLFDQHVQTAFFKTLFASEYKYLQFFSGSVTQEIIQVTTFPVHVVIIFTVGVATPRDHVALIINIVNSKLSANRRVRLSCA